MLHDGRIRFMADSQYVWWIDERLPAAEGGGIQARRSLRYGPYADKDTAELEIEQLRRTARYRKADLVPSKQRGPDAAIN